MFVLIHLLFTLFKIAIQASVYAVITLLLIYVLSKSIQSDILNKIMRRKFFAWWLTGSTFSIGLFFFSLSYWGYHGFGDSSRIPIGFGQDIKNVDGFTFFNPTSSIGQESIQSFQIENNYLCARQKDNTFFAYNIETKLLTRFNSKQDYNGYAAQNNLVHISEFKEFRYHYNNYWNGWRFIILP